ncbi:MAG: hypothetical protein AAGH15_16725 [Myxococcota bacterium]
MEIFFARLDPKTHRFRVARPPHPAVDVRLETRSLLLHDMAHYAVEATLGTEEGFYGHLARGTTLPELRALEERDALMAIERQVVGLQMAHRRGAAPSDPASRTLRAITGAWRKARQGEALRLRWPDPSPELVPAPPSPRR